MRHAFASASRGEGEHGTGKSDSPHPNTLQSNKATEVWWTYSIV
jgi:hypothetical protein